MAMQTENQKTSATDKFIAGLCRPAAYDHKITEVEIVETHISWVLLAGSFAYKIKKPVNFGFLDFSTLEKRRHCCNEEVRLNRRLAPQIYLQVVPITGTVDLPQMDGDGEAIEYAVKMHRFGKGLLLSELSDRGRLQTAHIDQIANLVADFHGRIGAAPKSTGYGEAQDIHHWFVENFEHIQPLLDVEHRLQQLHHLRQWGQQQWQSNLPLMRQRKAQGFVRECHGDLHLGNMVLVDDQVTAFDCIEFNEQLRWIDIISEVAFVMMDLLYRGHNQFAYRFINHYLFQSGDYPGLQLLRYYLVYRAMVRAKVSILQRNQQQTDAVAAAKLQSAYEAHADLAEKFTVEDKPLLMLMHGFSGSGKSTVAGQLAELLGAVWIRSDIERKRIFGFSSAAKTASGINEGLYSGEATERTYQRLGDISRTVLAAGYSVIADAAFLEAPQRRLFHDLAAQSQVPLLILDCRTPEQQLIRRITQRLEQAADPSEATPKVLRHQMRTADPLTDQERNYVIAVDTSGEITINRLLERIKSRG